MSPEWTERHVGRADCPRQHDLPAVPSAFGLRCSVALDNAREKVVWLGSVILVTRMYGMSGS
jgi:hypothetical protein